MLFKKLQNDYDFLKTNASGILVLESMSGQDRDSWVQHILSEALDFNIPQTETWIHSARIGRKASLRLGVELQSLFNTIYGGAPKTLETALLKVLNHAVYIQDKDF